MRAIFSLGAAALLAVAPFASPALAHEYAGHSTADGAVYTQLPMAFEPNRGQTDGRVDFLARGRGYTVFVTPTETVLSMRRDDATQALRMQMVGADSRVQAGGLGELPGRVNYLVGNDPAAWQVGLPTFGRVQYQGVYPGIDLEYYGHQGQLEYDFVVGPGADPHQIALKFEGAESIELDAAGDMVLTMAGGAELRQPRPFVYQDLGGQRVEVGGNFSVKDATVGFDVGTYDTSKPLVIDPVLEYSTFLGGSGDENYWFGVWGAGIAVDGKGAAYVVGSTTSSNFPTTRGSLDQKFDDGGMDVFVAKINPAGTALEYSTYLGGTGFDMGFGIALDSAGNAYVTGLTTSAADFPLVNPYQAIFGGGAEDAFVSKLNTTGSALIYSTFLGGNGPGWGEAAYGIAVHNSSAYVVGVTNSTNFPLVSAAQPVLGGMTDIFVTRVSSPGNSLMYSTFLGGADEDVGYGIATDRFGSAYVTGIVKSDGLASSPAVFKPTRSGPSDAIVAKYRDSGARLYSTYLGGGGDEIGYGIAADATGSVYVAGRTGGTFHITPGFFNPTCLDPAGFVAKLTADATGLMYAGCLDAPGKDAALDLAIDHAGNAYVTGFTLSPGFPTVDAFQTSLKGTHDAFVSKINAAGSALVYSSFLGGSGIDRGLSIAVDNSGHAYVTGITGSPVDFPTKNPLQPAHGGGSFDAFVVKIDCGP